MPPHRVPAHHGPPHRGRADRADVRGDDGVLRPARGDEDGVHTRGQSPQPRLRVLWLRSTRVLPRCRRQARHVRGLQLRHGGAGLQRSVLRGRTPPHVLRERVARRTRVDEVCLGRVLRGVCQPRSRADAFVHDRSGYACGLSRCAQQQGTECYAREQLSASIGARRSGARSDAHGRAYGLRRVHDPRCRPCARSADPRPRQRVARRPSRTGHAARQPRRSPGGVDQRPLALDAAPCRPAARGVGCVATTVDRVLPRGRLRRTGHGDADLYVG